MRDFHFAAQSPARPPLYKRHDYTSPGIAAQGPRVEMTARGNVETEESTRAHGDRALGG